MQAERIIEPLQPKTWQIETEKNGAEGYLYYCVLCDEALVLSRTEINPRKIRIVFNETCPGCGFELERVLSCRATRLPNGRRLLTNLKCRDAEVLLEPEDKFEPIPQKGSSLPRDLQPHITTGFESLDKSLILKKGQLAFLQGEPSNALSLLLCVRATLPPPEGFNSEVVFIDAGNLFDSYTVSQHAANHNFEIEKVQERIHLSRAFTHHQVYSLITEKLPAQLDEHQAKLAVVSDITALFCDPDVREKKEALDMFRKAVRFLATTAEQRNLIMIATNLKTRSKTMEDILLQTAHVSAILKDKGAYTQLTVARHPFLSEKQEEITLDNQSLVGYLG